MTIEPKKPLTFAEFERHFQGVHLLFLVESWSCRKALPSELGSLVDQHKIRLSALLREMFDALILPPVVVPKPATFADEVDRKPLVRPSAVMANGHANGAVIAARKVP